MVVSDCRRIEQFVLRNNLRHFEALEEEASKLLLHFPSHKKKGEPCSVLLAGAEELQVPIVAGSLLVAEYLTPEVDEAGKVLVCCNSGLNLVLNSSVFVYMPTPEHDVVLTAQVVRRSYFKLEGEYLGTVRRS